MSVQADDVFLFDPNADLPFEREWVDWLEGATISDIEWIVTDEAAVVNTLVVLHSPSNDTTEAITWVRGTGVEGVCYVTCRIRASDNRVDDRSWKLQVEHR